MQIHFVFHFSSADGENSDSDFEDDPKHKVQKEIPKPVEEDTKSSSFGEYRCNLKGLYDLINGIRDKINEHHLYLFRGTPFGSFFMLFYEKRFDRDSIVTKTTSSIISVIGTYSYEEDAFRIGDKLLKLSEKDIALTLGLPLEGKMVQVFPRNTYKAPKSDFYLRNFEGEGVLQKSVVVDTIKNSLIRRNIYTLGDFVKLVIMYMAATIFFPSAAGTLASSFIQHVDDFDTFKSICWPSVIQHDLMSRIRSRRSKPTKFTGCVLQLLYWVCEHTSVIQPLQIDAITYPRVARWNLTKMTKAISKEMLLNLPNNKESENDLSIREDMDKVLLGDDLVEKEKIRLSKRATKRQHTDNVYPSSESKKSRTEYGKGKGISDTGHYETPVLDISKEKLKDVCKSPLWRYLNGDQKLVVKTFFNQATKSTSAWTSDDLTIKGFLLEDLMFNRFISDEIIDWFTSYLRENGTNNAKSKFFGAMCKTFVAQGNEKYVKILLEDVLEEADDDVEFCFFPMNTPKTIKSKEGYHWTLLRLDWDTWEWLLFNSMKPRSGSNKYIRDT
ncbi:hypothetical protein IFM89_019838 [Coptis chinensis]|uniref:Ubiquitin-like protease family profile domain-containing protein n=1 Tax=Coptis chinensis TaxID=261450 RepID=A0A835M0S6_9MAGN|nr:hypothetical protein IFM89_019838 [Coptis chinensis]